jgi:hypothetical protein
MIFADFLIAYSNHHFFIPCSGDYNFFFYTGLSTMKQAQKRKTLTY